MLVQDQYTARTLLPSAARTASATSPVVTDDNTIRHPCALVAERMV